MKKINNVLSLCDGISMFQYALKKSGIEYKNYFSGEISETAMSIAMKNFPKTKQLGDIRNIKGKNLPEIDIMVAGFPCQQFSRAGNEDGLTDIHGNVLDTYKKYREADKKGWIREGSQSHIFWEVYRIFKEVKPKYFIFENVKMDPKWMYIISTSFGVSPILIDSKLVSAQHRERYYWTNIPGAIIPKDKGIHLSSIIPDAIGGHGVRNIDTGKKTPEGKKVWRKNATTRKDGKANCLTTRKGNCSKVELKDGTIRQITIEEAEQLQNLPSPSMYLFTY